MRGHLPPAESERLEHAEKDAAQSKCLRIVLLTVRGYTAPVVAMSVWLSRRICHRWLALYNEFGFAGLNDRRVAEPPSPLTPEQESLVRQRVETGRGVVVQLNAAEAKLDALIRDDSRGSDRAAETIAAHVDRPQLFKYSRQVSAYAGLVPRQYQSGQTDRRGPRLLRKMLVEAPWVMLRYNDAARRIVERISKGQRTRKRQAVVALARKLLVRCWAMLRHETTWREPVPLASA